MQQNNINDLELLKRAKSYIDKLAQGINPFTDLPAEEDSCVNNVKLSRCYFFVSDILRQVIENGGYVGKREFSATQLTEQVLSELKCLDNAVTITPFAKSVAEVFEKYGMKGIPATAYTSWLVSKHLLDDVVAETGKVRKAVNKYSESVGIFTEEREGYGKSYTAILYSVKAQQFLLDNIAEILAFYNSSKNGENNEDR